MTDEIQPTVPNPYQPPSVAQNVPPRPQAPRPAEPAKYKPWTRPLTYVVFGLGMATAGFLMFTVPYAIVTGWFALGCGIPAVLLAKKEIGRCPEAEGHGFIKWGRRIGLLGIIIGPISAIIEIIIVVAIGLDF